MLPFIRVTLHVLFCFAGLQTLAQCGYSGVNYGDVTPPGVGSTVSYPFYVWGGDQYSLVANAGCTYQVSMCGTSWDTQITVFDPALGVAAYNDDFCGLASQVTFTAAVSGIYTIQVNQYFCGTNFTAAEVFNVTLVSCASVGGCNNPAACNYDPAATNAANCCYSNCVNFSAGGGFFDNEISWSIADANGVVMGSGIATPNTLLCLPDGCYTITLFDSFGDGWNGAFWQATLNGVVLGTGSMNDGSLSFGYLEVGAVDCGFPEPIQVQTGIYSAQQLISDVFLGDCLEAMNIQFSGADAAIGTFSNGGDIGIEEGIVLTTGNALGAVGPNTSGSETAIMGTGSSLLLEAMTGEWTYDAVEFTFDFVASTSQVTFDYVFASDEYPEFVCSFNDAFAFFVSGPGYAPNTNIAVVPGTTDFVSIDNVNNNGAACPPYYPAYYVDNSGGTAIEYDGHTTVLQATINTVPCETYQITIALADLGDSSYDSAVFLRAESFNSGLDVEVAAIGESGIQSSPAVCEPNGSFIFVNNGEPFTEPTDVTFVLSGTAAEGVVFEPITTTVTFQPGQTIADVDIAGMTAGLTNAPESITLTVENSCSCTAPAEATLFLCSLIMLPLEQLSFDAMLVADGITHCDWQLEHAFNPEIYYLERSSDLMHWEVVKTISASANQESGVDFATPEGSTYYRVRVVLSGGTEIVSNSDHVSWKKRIFEVSPNPGNDVFSLSGSNLESLVIYDVSGRVIGFSWLSNNQIAIHTPAAGCYIFEVGGDNNAPPLRQRVIIN